MTDHAGYWYEKYAVIAVARYLQGAGYEVRISVPPETIEREALGGLEVPEVSEIDFENPQHRYRVYYDTPGNIDLVARKDDEVWLIEAKGVTTRNNAPGVVAQAIGQIVLPMNPTRPMFRYALVLPDKEQYISVFRDRGVASNNPVLARDDFRIFLVSRTGEVKEKRFAEVIDCQSEKYSFVHGS